MPAAGCRRERGRHHRSDRDPRRCGRGARAAERNPASLSVIDESYPTADHDGQLQYIQFVDLSALEQAMRQADGTPAALESRVLLIHGVPQEAGLPDTGSPWRVPAHLTLPIGCAELGPPL